MTSHNARNNELDVSLLERLFERPIYADHPLARAKFSWLNVSQGMEGEFFHPKLIRKHKSLVPFVNLIKVSRKKHTSFVAFTSLLRRTIVVIQQS